MTVTELLAAIMRAYPGATPEAMATFKPVFQARFEKREGPHLAKALHDCMSSFNANTRKPFPIPADIEAHMPVISVGTGGPALDFTAHGEKVRQIMAEWREAQGHRGANGVREVMRALEFIAEPLANVLAWKPGNQRLRLTTAHLKLAQHRAISARRRDIHGTIMPSLKADDWWDQIRSIGESWNIPMTRADWESTTKTAAANAEQEAA